MKKNLPPVFMMVMVAAAIAASLAVPSYARSSAEAALQQSGELELLAQFGLMDPLGMVVSGDLAFVGLQKGKLAEVVIFDVANPAQPTVLAVIPFDTGEYHTYEGFQAYPLAVVGEILYVGVPRLESTGWMYGGLKMFDVRDPSNPIPIGEVSPMYNMCPVQIVISGNYAYMRDNNGGVNILDISNPVNPSLVGYFLDGPYNALAVQGSYAYTLGGLGGNFGGVIIYDISNPSMPTFVSTYKPEGDRGFYDSIIVEGNYAYAFGSSMWGAGPFTGVIDISDPTHPVPQSDLPQFSFAYKQLIFSDNLLYAARLDGLAIYDASDPLNPLLLGVYLGFDGAATQPQGDVAAFLDRTGFQTVNTSDPAHPSRQGFYSWPQAVGSSGGIAAEGNNLFTVGTVSEQTGVQSFFQVIDITVPGEPQVSGELIIDSWIGKIFVSSSYLYLPTRDGLTNRRRHRSCQHANRLFGVELPCVRCRGAGGDSLYFACRHLCSRAKRKRVPVDD